MKTTAHALIVVSALALTNLALAQEAKPAGDAKPKSEQVETKDLKSSLDAFNFGIGIGFENYKSGYVNEAETSGTGRIVRVTDSQKMKPSLWLETHYLWDRTAKEWGFTHTAPGLYVGLRALGPDSTTFDAFSVGLLWAFKRTALGMPPPAGQKAESLNIGFGPVWHRTKRLADGIEEGKELPSDYQDIKYKKKDEISWMMMVSVGF